MRVLIAEDDPVSRRLLEASVSSWGLDTVLATDGNEAWHILESPNRPSLAILDWMMPGMTGLEVCRRVRENAPEPYLYIMLLTGRDCMQSMVEGLEAGADDYLTKPFDPAELRARLGTAQRILSLHRQLIAAREASDFQATFDGLTGIRNRSAILDRFDFELRRSLREGTPLAVGLADLDRFKQINDTLGHQAGDAVLVEAAGRMAAALGPRDCVGRYGGEEFLILLPEADDLRGAARVLDEVRHRIADCPIETAAGAVDVTSSFGLVMLEPGREIEAGLTALQIALLRAVDQALYRAKANGRNRVEVAVDHGESRAA